METASIVTAKDILDLLTPLASAILSSCLTGWVLVRRQKKEDKRLFTISLMDKYMSPQFNIARHVVGEVQRRWDQPNSDRECVKRFLLPIVPAASKEEQMRNGLTEHENLSWFLHFYAALHVYQSANLVDTRLMEQLFHSFYEGHQRFLIEFVHEYTKQMQEPGRRQDVQPAWVRGLIGLEAFFHPRRETPALPLGPMK